MDETTQKEPVNIRIIVATHKEYRMPEDPLYLPLLVGAGNHPAAEWAGLKDNTGDNISEKNSGYCELTGLYWAWKNLQADYLGLVHYRRHFSNGKKTRDKFQRIITGKSLEKELKSTAILLPKPRHYIIETTYSQYAHAHHSADLDLTRTILAEKYPADVSAFDTCMKRTVGHRFNMFVMRRDLLDRYCTWLFDILFELEKRLDISGYSGYDARVFGFVGERLLDVWIAGNKYPYKNLPYVFLDKQNRIAKGYHFLKRKWSRQPEK